MAHIIRDPCFGIRLIGRDFIGSHYLMHHGVKGQKRGRRQWQNEDGSYTPAGYQHYKEMYGWGEKQKTAKSDSENSSAGAKDNASSGRQEESGKTSSEYNRQAKQSGKMAGKMAIAGASSFGLGAIGTRVASMAASSAHINSIMQRIDAKNITDTATKLYTQMQSLHSAKLAEAFSHVADITSVFGTAAVAAFGLGVIGFGAFAAYSKIRASLANKKEKNTVVHSEETMADVLDALSDKQKLALLMIIDECVTGGRHETNTND